VKRSRWIPNSSCWHWTTKTYWNFGTLSKREIGKRKKTKTRAKERRKQLIRLNKSEKAAQKVLLVQEGRTKRKKLSPTGLI
jgi:hypothetical protein